MIQLSGYMLPKGFIPMLPQCGRQHSITIYDTNTLGDSCQQEDPACDSPNGARRMNDEQAIRALIETWMSASQAGDTDTVLGLMTDDVVFMVPGGEPFGKEAFAAASRGMAGMTIDGSSEILELRILGDWATVRTHLRLAISRQDGSVMCRSGLRSRSLRRVTMACGASAVTPTW